MNLPTIFRNRDNWLTSFDSIFDKMFSASFPDLSNDLGADFFGKASYPKCNIVTSPDKITVEAAIPGYNKDSIKVELQDNILTLRGESNTESSDGDKTYVRREIKRSKFERSFVLSDDLEADNIEASFNNGLLILSIPRKEKQEKTVKTIDIRS